MSSCFCFAFFTQADSTRLIENEAFSSNANNSPVMTTHSPSFPPDHYILAVQVRTVVHPLLQKRSSLVSPLLKGAQHRSTEESHMNSEWFKADFVLPDDPYPPVCFCDRACSSDGSFPPACSPSRFHPLQTAHATSATIVSMTTHS